MKKIFLFTGLMLCMILTGCQMPDTLKDNAETKTEAEAEGDVSASEETPSAGTAPAENFSEPDTSADEKKAVLYIGTQAGGFGEYPFSYEKDLTPELLIQGIADLTGWNLSLAETVTMGKGGMSVCLSNESSLFTGPPDPQNEAFHMYDSWQLSETVLDSIQKTLQMGFTGEGGDPDALDIYYYMEGELPLELPELGLSWALDEPYRWKIPVAE